MTDKAAQLRLVRFSIITGSLLAIAMGLALSFGALGAPNQTAGTILIAIGGLELLLLPLIMRLIRHRMR